MKTLKFVLSQRVEKEYGKKVIKTERLTGGGNNAGYFFKLEDERELFIKKYYKDERERLEREYSAISYFEKLKLFRVPKPYFSDNKLYIGVYEFIRGEVKKAVDSSREEILDLVDYAVKLHSIKPTEEAKRTLKRNAVLPVFSLSDHVANLRFKYGRFFKYYKTLDSNNDLRKKIDKARFNSRIEDSLKKILKTLPGFDLKRKISPDKIRFNHIDYGLHNVIYKKINGKEIPYFIDYELSGWDDPYRMIGDFMSHDKNKVIPSNLREMFVEEYKKRRDLNQKEALKLDVTLRLMDVEWIATYLWSIAPDKIDLRRAAIYDFNEKEYVKKQLAKVEERLVKIEKELSQ